MSLQCSCVIVVLRQAINTFFFFLLYFNRFPSESQWKYASVAGIWKWIDRLTIQFNSSITLITQLLKPLVCLIVPPIRIWFWQLNSDNVWKLVPTHTHTFSMASVPVYCLCRLPYDVTRFMIECDICQDWFHGRWVIFRFNTVSIILLSVFSES